MPALNLARSAAHHVRVLPYTDAIDGEGVHTNPDDGIQLAIAHGDPITRELAVITHDDDAAAIAVLAPDEAIRIALELLVAAGVDLRTSTLKTR